MLLCAATTNQGSLIHDFADIANIFIAFVNLILAGYIFIYQRGKDQTDRKQSRKKETDAKKEALNLQEQNIRLQWFKELIIQPHLSEINGFYKQLFTIEKMLTVATITDELKFVVSGFVKGEAVKLRKSFVDILRVVSPQMHDDIKDNIDKLIDQITNKIFDPGLNLNDKPTFDKEIGTLITYSSNDLISKIWSYKGS